MDRAEQIKQQAKLLCNTVSPEEYFIKGGQWADNNPADETIQRIVTLYKEWYTTESMTSMVEYIKNHF